MANPLTFIMPIVADVTPVEIIEALGQQQSAIDEALTAVGTVHYARFVVFDLSQPNLLPGSDTTGPFSLAVITSYDGDFDVYVQAFVNHLGRVFDVLLSFMPGGAAYIPVDQRVPQFTALIAANNASQQPPNSAMGMYEAYPYTVQQILALSTAS